jgi:hypothetical protein
MQRWRLKHKSQPQMDGSVALRHLPDVNCLLLCFVSLLADRHVHSMAKYSEENKWFRLRVGRVSVFPIFYLHLDVVACSAHARTPPDPWPAATVSFWKHRPKKEKRNEQKKIPVRSPDALVDASP